jgi:transposase
MEHRQHTLECDGCGTWTSADLPDHAPSSQFGPVVSAIVTYLTGKAHLSKRLTRETMADVFGVEMSLGTVSNKEATATEAMAGPYREARGWIAEAGQVHLDETTWREAESDGWLWVIADGEVAAYLVDESRGSEVAEDLLDGQPSGRAEPDRHTAYNWIRTESRQICLPHLHRNFKGWALEEGLTGEIGGLLASYMKELFVWLGRIRDGTIGDEEFRDRVAELRDQISTALQIGASASNQPERFEQLLGIEEAMWTHQDVDGLPADNNAAERALRSAVLWRKQSFGTESDRGSRYVERMLTAAETLKRQGRPVMDFLEDIWRDAMFDEPTPSLLPA